MRIATARKLPILLVLLAVIAAAPSVGGGQEELPGASCLVCGGHDPSCASCACEQEPGWNLYWHNPCGDVSDPCRYWDLHPQAGRPDWYAITELVPLTRDANELNFQSIGPTRNFVLGTSLFEPEFDAGARATLGRTLGDCYRVEASYLGSYSWSDSAAVRNLDANALGGAGNLFSPFSNFGNPAAIPGVDFNNFASIRFSSNLNSAELNIRRRLDLPPHRYARGEVSFLVGARYMKIDEQFDYLSVTGVPAGGSTNQITVNTDNDMIGIQSGVLAQILVHRRGWLDLEGKGAIMNNSAGQDTTFATTDPNGGVVTSFGAADKDRTAFLADLSATFNYQFAPAWTFRIGYNAMWLSGLALAHENVIQDINILRLGPSQLNHQGEVAYHGPSIGLVWVR